MLFASTTKGFLCLAVVAGLANTAHAQQSYCDANRPGTTAATGFFSAIEGDVGDCPDPITGDCPENGDCSEPWCGIQYYFDTRAACDAVVGFKVIGENTFSKCGDGRWEGDDKQHFYYRPDSVSTLHVVLTMLSVWQEHTASVCDVYTTMQSIAVHSFTFCGFSVCSCLSCVANGHAVIVTRD